MARIDIGQEKKPEREQAYIDDLIPRLKEQMHKDNPQGMMRRDAHPKMHGVVKAEFIVEPNLPKDLRLGIFSEPKTYKAWIRFSNSAGAIKPDIKRDIRGMAIKLMGVPGDKILDTQSDGETHDLILASANVFMCGDMKELLAFAKAFTGNLLAKLVFFTTHWRVVWILYKTMVRFSNPLQIRYFSTTPYAFGFNHSVKYAATPVFKDADQIPAGATDDYLRVALENQLREGEVLFDFGLQFQTDPVKMPVEDCAHVWKETDSPFRKVATIRILQQECGSNEQAVFGENLSFSPWRCLPEHRPLGGINRARKIIYEAISEYRHDLNDVHRKEPDSWRI